MTPPNIFVTHSILQTSVRRKSVIRIFNAYLNIQSKLGGGDWADSSSVLRICLLQFFTLCMQTDESAISTIMLFVQADSLHSILHTVFCNIFRSDSHIYSQKLLSQLPPPILQRLFLWDDGIITLLIWPKFCSPDSTLVPVLEQNHVKIFFLGAKSLAWSYTIAWSYTTSGCDLISFQKLKNVRLRL